MAIVRTHFSRQPVTALRDAEMPLTHVQFKPLGFWYGVNGDWERWCQSENCDSWVMNGWRYPVRLGTARLLYLRSAAAIHRFTRHFCFQDDPHRILWPAVATVYDGIEIAPYQWDCRLDPRTAWYYAWDCASGVVWNASKLRLGKPTRLATLAHEAATQAETR